MYRLRVILFPEVGSALLKVAGEQRLMSAIWSDNNLECKARLFEASSGEMLPQEIGQCTSSLLIL
jgi:hypothetical protein